MGTYKVLDKQVYSIGDYSIVPLRSDDRYFIMQWRNEQIYHLRQSKPLTKEDQDAYFDKVVSKLFDQEQPNQVLFSFLERNICIGYGGLVHINWLDQNAEISFLMDTSLEQEYFEFHWINYLQLIEQIAFEGMRFHKIFTYAYNLRPRLFKALDKKGFIQEAVLKEHHFIDGKYIDVLIHAKLNNYILLREAIIDDLKTTYRWANDKTVRTFSYNRNKITEQEHFIWFSHKIASEECVYFILEKDQQAVGSIRFDIEKNGISAKINYLIASEFTGNGYGSFILTEGIQKLKQNKPAIETVYGFVFLNNQVSIKIFNKHGYKITFENGDELKFEKKLK
jgi:RimJ/RimL family protein N-acetyltransferase